MRGREPPRRAAPARSDWDRGRDHHPRNPRKSGSPIKSKLMAMAMPSSRDKDGGKPTTKPRKDRESSKDRERAVQKRRLRMDEHEDRGGRSQREQRSPVRHRPDAGHKRPGVSNLDKVVKKAREERNNYWDKKIIEAEEKDPDRWGHSGFKELYHKKDGKKVSSVKRGRSRSNSTPRRTRRSRSPAIGFGKRRSRSYSRSRSPISRFPAPRKHGRSFSRSLSPAIRSKNTATKSKLSKLDSGSKLDSRNSRPLSLQTKLNASVGKAKLVVPKVKSGGARTTAKTKGRPPPRRSSSYSSSGSSISRSLSRSRSRSYQTPSNRKPRARILRKGKANKPSGAASASSYSSSSSSSDDEDVLQLHAKGRNRSSSFSHSDSRSSSSSRGKGGAGVKRKGSAVSTSSSESASSSDSDSDISIRAKPVQNPVPPKAQEKTTTLKTVVALKKITTVGDKLAKKPTSALQTNNVSKPGTKLATKPATKKATTPKVVASKSKNSIPKSKPVTPLSKSTDKEKNVVKKASKAPSESGETESESDSSDSDSEPRMTLSERFAKLSQMSTDKRELAKPVLAVSEIDTKMRVVKDFRNPEAPKVYVAGNSSAPTASDKPKPPRSRSPPVQELNRRDNSEERRRHFERMYRDAPEERPMDWSDAKVRFNYYKTRGCFDERPITFEEYIKWEEWYHKYKEWLEEQEGYYGSGGRGPPGARQSFEPASRMHGRIPMSRRIGVDHHDRLSGQPLSTRSHFGRPEGNAYLQAHQRIGRQIDRTSGGSLVVNIRPGYNNTNGFDARHRLGPRNIQ